MPAERTVSVLRDLLTVLDAEPQSPRSVQVRLYHLLQTSREKDIRRIWSDFGVDLMAGIVATYASAPSGEPTTKPLWSLKPSAAHLWAARLAVQNRAAIVSLNYDGLTKRAVENVAADLMRAPPESRKTARVLSSAAEIRTFFTGIELVEAGTRKLPSEAQANAPWHPVPIIKFRGDVFHAVCENGRCPEFQRPSALYQCLTFLPKKQPLIQVGIPLLQTKPVPRPPPHASWTAGVAARVEN